MEKGLTDKQALLHPSISYQVKSLDSPSSSARLSSRCLTPPVQRKLQTMMQNQNLSHWRWYLLHSEVSCLKSACNTDVAKIQSLQLALSSPLLVPLQSQPEEHHVSFTYSQLMQEPDWEANRITQMLGDGSNLMEWIASLN
ncbi:hypothetical protein O181_014247 [Austropuccinia psidii MF-1]|uniref:Uncharacterized protein n=1 Tax=Austropuccinia psidii MF-1 TaxID=1389203 RepID=A0A9Q3BZU4_9BASI|nr:hypothetical protein [Austropuccinia psidii MF-1]